MKPLVHGVSQPALTRNGTTAFHGTTFEGKRIGFTNYTAGPSRTVVPGGCRKGTRESAAAGAARNWTDVAEPRDSAPATEPVQRQQFSQLSAAEHERRRRGRR